MPLTADLDRAAVDKLAARIERDVDDGLLPAAQFALALDGEIVEERAFGDAGPDTRFCLFSATKPFVAATVWRLIAAGDLDPALPVTTWFPAFGANGKDAITLEQVMLHTSGFPTAPMGPAHWSDRADPPGADGVVAPELGARHALRVPPDGRPLGARRAHRDGHRHRLPRRHPRRSSPRRSACRGSSACRSTTRTTSPSLRLVGEHATSRRADGGVRRARRCRRPRSPTTPSPGSTSPTSAPSACPGGGGFARAVDVARFYQALLHGDEDVWPADLLHDVTTNVRNRLPDPAGTPANRSLGLHPRRRRRVRPRPRVRAHRVAGHVRPQRRRRADRVGRPGHRPVVRVRHERLRPPRGAPAAPHDVARQPGRGHRAGALTTRRSGGGRAGPVDRRLPERRARSARRGACGSGGRGSGTAAERRRAASCARARSPRSRCTAP